MIDWFSKNRNKNRTTTKSSSSALEKNQQDKNQGYFYLNILEGRMINKDHDTATYLIPQYAIYNIFLNTNKIKLEL